MKIWTTALASGLAAVLAVAAANASPSGGLKGRSYDEVRERLISRGVTPVRIDHKGKTSWVCGGGFCEIYPEVLDCTGAGIAACRFAFWDRRAGEPLVVTTRGEVELHVTDVGPAFEDERLEILAGQKAPEPAGPFDDLKGRSYGEARKALTSRGVSPVRVSHDKASRACREGRCETYPEVLNCGSGLDACSYAFWNGRSDAAWVVITRGEAQTVVKVRPARDDERAEIVPD